MNYRNLEVPYFSQRENQCIWHERYSKDNKLVQAKPELDGTPLRAICKVVFKEYATAATQLSNTRRESADHTKRMALREGETLSSLSAVEFSKVSKVNIDKLLSLIKTSSGRVKLNSEKPNQIILKTEAIDLKSKSDFIKEKLEQLL